MEVLWVQNLAMKIFPLPSPRNIPINIFERIPQWEPVWVIERYPKFESSGYTKIVSWVNQSNFQTVKQEFFDRKGTVLKIQTIKGLRCILRSIGGRGK